MKELVSALLVWISLQFAAEPPVPPDIRFVSRQELAERLYGGDAPADAPVTAVYNRETGTVYLAKGWRIDSLRDRSILLHELVHHTQQRCALPYPCLAARERDAYEMQADWLRQHGESDPYAVIGVDEFTVRLTSMCRPS